MKRMTAGDLQALELLMQTTPGFEHFDSGADGILPECRSCRFHRPFWKYQSCVFAESWITKSKSSRMNSLEKSEQP